MALPPWRRISAPTSEAVCWAVTTMPSLDSSSSGAAAHAGAEMPAIAAKLSVNFRSIAYRVAITGALWSCCTGIKGGFFSLPRPRRELTARHRISLQRLTHAMYRTAAIADHGNIWIINRKTLGTAGGDEIFARRGHQYAPVSQGNHIGA